MKNKTVAFYVPINFDSSMFPESQRDYAHYFLNLLHWKYCCWQANKEGFVQLKYAFLIKVIPREMWRDLWERLLGFKDGYPEVVESDLKSAPGKCEGYRLHPDYRKTHRILCTNAKLNRKLYRIYGKEERATLPIHRWLNGKFDLLEFDMERACSIIARMKPKRTGKGFRPAVKEYRLQRTDYCRRIANKDFWFSCDNYGRVHTPITALEKELRCCLSVNGRPLVNIDLSNSQPLLLGIFARQYFEGGMTRSRFLNKSFDDRKSPYCPKEVRAMAKRSKRNLPADLEKYVSRCERGRFYESLMTAGEKERGAEYRDRFKKRFYRVLFGRNRPRDRRFRNQIRDRFRKRYPSVAEVLRELKKKNYRNSSHVLQNYEATLFIHIICGRIMKERPNLVLYTIHDSILTTPDGVDYVKGVIREEFKKLGVTPKLREEQ